MGLEPVLHHWAEPGPQMQSQVGVPLHAAGRGAQLGRGGAIGSPVVPPKPKPTPLQGARQYWLGPHVAPHPRPLTAPAAPATPAAPAAAAPPPPAMPPTCEMAESPALALPPWATPPEPPELSVLDPAAPACAPLPLCPALETPGSWVASPDAAPHWVKA